MRYAEFVTRVQELAGISQPEAQRAVSATLETLGERLYHTDQEHLAAQLPDELKAPLLEHWHADRFVLADFYHRVAARADLTHPQSVEQAQAVMVVLGQAVTPAQWEAVRDQLPDEYHILFRSEPAGPTIQPHGGMPGWPG